MDVKKGSDKNLDLLSSALYIRIKEIKGGLCAYGITSKTLLAGSYDFVAEKKRVKISMRCWMKLLMLAVVVYAG